MVVFVSNKPSSFEPFIILRFAEVEFDFKSFLTKRDAFKHPENVDIFARCHLLTSLNRWWNRMSFSHSQINEGSRRKSPGMK